MTDPINDEDLHFERQKCDRILKHPGEDGKGLWTAEWSARELDPILVRLARAERERDFLLESIKPNGDGFGWEPRDWDYRCHPAEVLRWAMASTKGGGPR